MDGGVFLKINNLFIDKKQFFFFFFLQSDIFKIKFIGGVHGLRLSKSNGHECTNATPLSNLPNVSLKSPNLMLMHSNISSTSKFEFR